MLVSNARTDLLSRWRYHQHQRWAADMTASETVQTYKDLFRVERAVNLKTVDLEILPIERPQPHQG